MQCAYLAPWGLQNLLIEELNHIQTVFDRLVVANGDVQKAYWVNNIWYDARIIPIQSIGHAARTLRSIQRNWWPFEFQLFRRMKLIQEQLPVVSAKPLNPFDRPPISPLGSWTLIDQNTMLVASHCSSPMPHGEWHFKENKIDPPSRAYLKLWEFFSRYQKYPDINDTCLDLGASPGGWTYVLAKLSRRVIAIDRSPLDPRIMAMPNVSFIARDAFSVDLSDYPEVSWVLSDVVCYPEKLYNFVKKLLEKFPDKKYVFTIKFQGSEHKEIISCFADLPGELVHLSQNKHELTWFCL